MSQYLSQFDVTASASLKDSEQKHLEFQTQKFRATLEEISCETFAEKAVLRLNVFQEAESLDDAEKTAQNYSDRLMEILSFTSAAHFGRPILRRIIDWTPGLEKRTGMVYLDAQQLSGPQKILDDALAQSVSRVIDAPDLSSHLNRAIHWYRQGLKGETPDLKVQAFWLCLETLVSGRNFGVKVEDKCARCRSPLRCPNCNGPSLHKPYEKQRIQLLLQEALRDGDELFLEASKARDTLAHGGTLIGPKDGQLWPYAGLVDRLGNGAWRCVVGELVKAVNEQTIRVLQRSEYNHRTYQIRSTFDIRVPLKDGVLLPESIPETKVELRKEGDRVVVFHHPLPSRP